MSDSRFVMCICPGCGWTGLRRPVEEHESDAAESFCNECGYEVNNAPYRLPSVDELVNGVAGDGFSQVNLGVFVPAVLRALRERGV